MISSGKFGEKTLKVEFIIIVKNIEILKYNKIQLR